MNLSHAGEKSTIENLKAQISCELSHHSYLDFLVLDGAILMKKYGVADEDEFPARYSSVAATAPITIEGLKTSITSEEKKYLTFSVFPIDPKNGEALPGTSSTLIQLHTFLPGGSYVSSSGGMDKFSTCWINDKAYDL